MTGKTGRSVGATRLSGRAAFRRSCAKRLQARPDIAELFLERGQPTRPSTARWRPTADSVEVELRRQRQGLALAVALGDLAGELSLEEVTRLLSDFADQAIDRALATADRASACRTPSRPGFAVIAMGKLGSRELNYSSDVDLLLLFDPETLAAARRATMPAKRRCGSAGG